MTSEDQAKVTSLLQRILAGQPAAWARAITWVENGGELGEGLVNSLARSVGRAHRVGLTGPPGAGKSTLVDCLASHARSLHRKVGILAVDPSSPFTGGALLGDRVRMSRSLEDPEVFVRSMATRGCLGGLCRTVFEAADVLDAGGKDLILLETVGVGQSELAVAQSADTCVVVLVPEAGGMVQAMKAGLMEIADIFVVNKCDRPGADEMKRQLLEAAHFLCKDGWNPPVLQTKALDSIGIESLYQSIEAHRDWLGQSGPALEDGQRLERKRQLQHEARIREAVKAVLEERLWSQTAVQSCLQSSAQRLRSGDIGLHAAVAVVWTQVLETLSESNGVPKR